MYYDLSQQRRIDDEHYDSLGRVNEQQQISKVGHEIFVKGANSHEERDRVKDTYAQLSKITRMRLARLRTISRQPFHRMLSCGTGTKSTHSQRVSVVQSLVSCSESMCRLEAQ